VLATLIILHTKRVRHVILSFATCLCLPYLSTLSHKPHDFRKQLVNIKCVFGFPLQRLIETFLIVRRTERDIIINVNKSSLSTRYSCQILMKLEFSQQNFDVFLTVHHIIDLFQLPT
jgi:hypothetical protein